MGKTFYALSKMFPTPPLWGPRMAAGRGERSGQEGKVDAAGLFTVPDLWRLFALSGVAEQEGTHGLAVEGDEGPEVTAAKGRRGGNY